LASLSVATEGLDRRDLVVEELSHSEACDLARLLFGEACPAHEARIEAIARESEGNPLFVAELLRWSRDRTDDPPIALDEALWDRIRRLPDDERQLLEIVAVNGRPLRPEDARQALSLALDVRGPLKNLRSGGLIRGTKRAEVEEVETYHDRVRETVVARLAPEIRSELHRRLGQVLEASGQADSEALGAHFRAAGELEQAGTYFAEAAAQAAEALAFDRAATLYRQALELRPVGGVEGYRLRTALGDALANAGRGADAARAYLEATIDAPAAEVFELLRRAATQFLTSGHIDPGLDALRTVLESVGMRLPSTPGWALASLLWHRARLGLRGLNFCEREPDRIAEAELSRVDVCWTAATGLSVADWICGSSFAYQGLRLALRAGEPFRIARALALATCHQAATSGGLGRHRTAALLAVVDRLARQIDRPYPRGMVALAEGVTAYLQGRWRDGLLGCDRAEDIFRNACTGVAWELDSARISACGRSPC
jgi:tetratricopeptide (TPR) repeat protein